MQHKLTTFVVITHLIVQTSEFPYHMLHHLRDPRRSTCLAVVALSFCGCFLSFFGFLSYMQSQFVLIGQVKQYFAYETQHQHGAFAMTGGFKYFLFSTLPGEIIHFDKYFSNGLKPPTRFCFWNSMVGRWNFLLGPGLFSGAVLVSGRVLFFVSVSGEGLGENLQIQHFGKKVTGSYSLT